MAEEKEALSSSSGTPLGARLVVAQVESEDPEDPAKSPASSPNYSTRKAFFAVFQNWVSKKFMTGCVVLFPVAITFYITWWFIQFVDGFFRPLYIRLGINIFGLGFITTLIFVFSIGLFVSSWMGATVLWVGEWLIKKMPFVRHIYSASKQISTAISPDQNITAFKEVAIIRHPRVGEYAFGFITSSLVLQNDGGDEELCSVYVPTNHLYIGDIFLINSAEIIRPSLSIREGIEIQADVITVMNLSLSLAVWVKFIEHCHESVPEIGAGSRSTATMNLLQTVTTNLLQPLGQSRGALEIIVSGGMTMPQKITPLERVPIAPLERVPRQNDRSRLNSIAR